MKGAIGVGVKIAGAASAGGVATGGTSAGSFTNLRPCASPQSTTVRVNMFEYSYTVSPATFPCGSVTFVMTNTGKEDHNFNVIGVQGGGAGNVVGPGETTTKTLSLGPGGYSYQCDVEGHLALGMVGNLSVTG
jgi:plastocyanin